MRGHFYACTSLAFFDQFPCFCWYTKVLLSQNYFCYYVILCYFLFFCALLTFSLHAFWNPLQPGFIHSESFLIKVIYSSHITKSKIELQIFFFLIYQQHLTMLPTFSLQTFLFGSLPTSLPTFADFVHLLIMHVGGPQGSCPLARLLAPFMRWWFLSQTSFPWLSLVWLVSLPLPSKKIPSPKAHQMQLTPSLIYCSYLVIQSKKLGVIFNKYLLWIILNIIKSK